jgi:hypothetical protein
VRAIAAVALLLELTSCRSPTQVRVHVRNDVPCPAQVVLRVDGEARSSASTCGGGSDDFVVVPRSDDADRFTIELATRTDGADPSSCNEGAAACIVQRWELSFRAHDPQTFSTTLSRECVASACAPGRTCAFGRCVASTIDRDCSDGCEPDDAGVPPDTGAPPDTAPPAPVTVRLINTGTIGLSGTLDVCVQTAAGMSEPLLAARKLEPIGNFEVTGSMPIPDDTGEVVTMSLTNSQPPDCATGRRASIKRPPPGGRLFALKKGAFDAVLAYDVPPSPSAGVTLRMMHAAARWMNEPAEFGMRLDVSMDVWPKELTGVAFGALSSTYVTNEKVLLVSGRTSSGGTNSGFFATPPAAGRTHTVFFFAEQDGPETVRVCDDYLADAQLRALCSK